MSWRKVGSVKEIPESGLKQFDLEGDVHILVIRCGDEYFAYQAYCPHMEVPLEEGFYDGSVLTCHQHLWQFDVRTGEPLGLAEAPLKGYPLRVEDGALYVLID